MSGEIGEHESSSGAPVAPVEQVFDYSFDSPPANLQVQHSGPVVGSASRPGANPRKRSHDETDEDDTTSAGEEPVEKKARLDMREETNLWTIVKQYLQDPDSENTAEPSVSCPICYCEIAIRGLPSQQPNPWKLADGRQKVGNTLPCAHIVCQDCIKQTLDAQKDSGFAPTCPICRLNLCHTICGHTVASKRLPLASLETVDMVPLTLPECQKGLPKDCLPCIWTMSTHMMGKNLNSIVNLVTGTMRDQEDNLQEVPDWSQVVDRIRCEIAAFIHDYMTNTPRWEVLDSSDEGLRVAFVDDEEVTHLDPTIRYSSEDHILVSEDTKNSCWFVPISRASMGNY